MSVKASVKAEALPVSLVEKNICILLPSEGVTFFEWNDPSNFSPWYNIQPHQITRDGGITEKLDLICKNQKHSWVVYCSFSHLLKRDRPTKMLLSIPTLACKQITSYHQALCCYFQFYLFGQYSFGFSLIHFHHPLQLMCDKRSPVYLKSRDKTGCDIRFHKHVWSARINIFSVAMYEKNHRLRIVHEKVAHERNG